MQNDPARRAWVERVLGVRLPASGGTGAGTACARWQRAQTQLNASLAAFRSALLADAAVKDDPRFAFVRAAVAEIPNMLPAPSRRIDALLAAAESSPAAAADAIEAIGDYRSALATTRPLARLEAFAAADLKVPLTLRETLGAALDDIAATLRSAV